MPRGTGSPGSVTSTASAAQRDVELARLEAARAAAAVQPLELAAHAVQLLAARPAQLCGQRAELAQRERQRARAPQRLDACIFELRGRRGPLELLAPLAFQAGRVLHGHPRVDAGTRDAPPRYHPACAVRRLSLPARSTASRPAREVNFGGPSTRGLSVTAPLPVEDGARLLVSVGAGTAILPRMRRGAAAPGGEPYERLGPLYDRWCAGVDHDIAVLRPRLRGRGRADHRAGRGQRAHRGRARPPRPSRDRARCGAGDAGPGRAPRTRATTWRSRRDRPRRPARPAAPAPERPRDRAVPHVHAPRRRRRAPARAARRGAPARRRRAVHLRRLRAERSRHPRHPRPLDRAPRGHQRAARSGTRTSGAWSSTSACPAGSSR